MPPQSIRVVVLGECVVCGRSRTCDSQVIWWLFQHHLPHSNMHSFVTHHSLVCKGIEKWMMHSFLSCTLDVLTDEARLSNIGMMG